ncbi:hypothetical protein EWM64_g9582, partial [Hericium alpestre]
TAQLRTAFLHIWLSVPSQPDSSFLDDMCVLTDGMLDAITRDLHLLMEKAALHERMEAWHWWYWDVYEDALWGAVDRVRWATGEALEARHELAEGRQRETADEECVGLPSGTHVDAINMVDKHVAEEAVDVRAD